LVLYNKLSETAFASGAEYFGVADLTPAIDFIRKQGGDLPASFPRAIAVGIVMPYGLTEPLITHDQDNGALMTYDRYVYQVCSPLIDQVTMKVARKVEKAGFRTMPVVASMKIPGKHFAGVFPHKLAAHLAGLGWIGKSCLLINPVDGPRVRWGTVLTNAPLNTGTVLDKNCGQCTECVKACPANAITGRPFSPGDPRSERLDVEKCHDYRQKLLATNGTPSCGKCLAACPYGKPKNRQ